MSEDLIWSHLDFHIRSSDRCYGGDYYFRISSAPPYGCHLFNCFYNLLICGNICSTCEVNIVTDFHTSTMRFRRLMGRIDHFLWGSYLFLKVASPFTRIRIQNNPSYQDQYNEYQNLFISDLLSIGI